MHTRCLGALRVASLFSALAWTATFGFAGVGCAEKLPPLDIPEGCSGLLVGVDCGLPYPSDQFLADDATMPSGKRIALTGAAKPLTGDGSSADATDFLPADGFSRTPTIVASLGVGLSGVNLTTYFGDVVATTLRTSPTLLIEVETGRLVGHFVDIDPRASDDTRQALVLHPLAPLRAHSRYIVVLHDVQAKAGGLAPAPEGFRRLRDDVAAGDAVLEPLSARFERDVFPIVAAAGVERSALQLAWDFTTGTDASTTADMLRARALTMDALAASPPSVTITSVVDNDPSTAPDVWRTVHGTVTGPRIVDTDDPGAVLARGTDGQVRLNGTTTFAFTAIVPVSVRDAFAAGIPTGFGHGFFSDQREVESFGTTGLFQAAGGVAFAIDWLGMGSGDVATVVQAIGDDVTHALRFGERVPQAMCNWISLTTALHGAMRDQPALRRPNEPGALGVVIDEHGESNAGALVYDDTRGVSFIGISQGGILGGTVAALDADIDRAVLNVGGAGFTHMMWRAKPFESFLGLIALRIPDSLDRQKFAASLQVQFDRWEPATYARYVLHEELPTGPSSHPERRQVLLQMGLGDTQVPNLGSWMLARALGISAITPSPVTPWGIDSESAPHTGSGLAIYDLGEDTAFAALAEPAPTKNGVHNGLRLFPEVRAQVRSFLREGIVTNPCAGACLLSLAPTAH